MTRREQRRLVQRFVEGATPEELSVTHAVTVGVVCEVLAGHGHQVDPATRRSHNVVAIHAAG